MSYFDQNYPAPVSNTINTVPLIFSKINKYDDGDLLNNYYKAIIARLKKDRQVLFDACRVKKVLREHVNDQILLKEKSLMFDAQLLDVNALHEVVNSDKDKVFVILGALHVTNVKSILQRLGYNEIVSINGDNTTYDYSRCERKKLYNKIMIDMSFEGTLAFCEKYKDNSDLLIYDGPINLNDSLDSYLDRSIIEDLSQKPADLMNKKYQNQISYYSVTHPSNFKK